MKQKGTTQPNKSPKSLAIKAILLGVVLIMLLSACVFFTMAWYTNMVSVSGLEFKTAEWDFTANYAVDDIIINVYEYATITSDPEPLAAPGTSGYIPLKMGTWQSDTDVQYTILVDRSSMSEEFQNRIFFFYLLDENNNIVNEEKAGTTRVYLHGSPSNPTVHPDDQTVMTGTIKRGGEAEVHILWEWVYEAPTGSTEEQIEAWDDYDTEVGKNPALYKNDMNAKVTVAGVQVKPYRGAENK